MWETSIRLFGGFTRSCLAEWVNENLNAEKDFVPAFLWSCSEHLHLRNSEGFIYEHRSPLTNKQYIDDLWRGIVRAIKPFISVNPFFCGGSIGSCAGIFISI